MFEFHQKVLFKHCDPAGIVFFPRYFEMINDCIEAFFDQGLNVPFHDLHREGALPTAQIQTQFPAPSRHGDQLIFQLQINRVGNSSATYTMTARCGNGGRLTCSATLVHIDADGRPEAWPDTIRWKLGSFMGEAA
ncbi:acyl-CoA thioesterase [Ruegeria denitrificans]|uniref:acyl-CoA thioesterase n=1 Tax=Ruegeria denitrificans TaxID=1715692 RepID=UPI00071D8E64|nr:thioesterase family protein [Ruegeria denitrificans]